MNIGQSARTRRGHFDGDLNPVSSVAEHFVNCDGYRPGFLNACPATVRCSVTDSPKERGRVLALVMVNFLRWSAHRQARAACCACLWEVKGRLQARAEVAAAEREVRDGLWVAYNWRAQNPFDVGSIKSGLPWFLGLFPDTIIPASFKAFCSSFYRRARTEIELFKTQQVDVVDATRVGVSSKQVVVTFGPNTSRRV